MHFFIFIKIQYSTKFKRQLLPRMKKLPLFLLILAVSALFWSVPVTAGEIVINNGKTEISYTAGSYQQLAFTSTVSSLLFRDVQTEKGMFTELFIKNYSFANEAGDPKLPVFRKLIEVPSGADFEIQITRMTYEEYDMAAIGIEHRIIPAQAPLSKHITDPSQIPFVINEATYQKDQFLGSPLVKVTSVGSMRATHMARLDISPVQYNPVTGKLRIFYNIQATVVFRNADVAETILLKKKKGSPYYENLFNLLPNYTSESDALITTSPVTFVIVSAPTFEATLQPLVAWKTRKGFQVIEAYTNNPNVGTTTSSIKAYLQGLYNTPPAGYNSPSFILFVGDVAQVPAFNTGGHPSDLRYCEYTNDNIPEVFYGRFSAVSASQVQALVNKTIEYEQYQIPNDAYLNEVTMVAGADANNGPLYGNGQINYGTSTYFNSLHNILSHTYLQPEPSGANYSQQIRNNVSNGVAYANYTAHGGEDGWSDPQFTINQIPPLQNIHKYCLMVGNCCKTSNYSTTCFAEEITRATNKGALGYIGCSDYSYWDEDYWWACGFKSVSVNPVYNAAHLGSYDITFHDHGEPINKWYVTQGQMVVGGNMAVEESNSGMKQYYWETYCLMGDPSLSIYFSVPPPLTALYPGALLAGGTSTMTVTTEPYAYVGLSVNDTTFLAGQCADSTGMAILNFNPIILPGYADIVVTKQNRKPLIDSISVIPASGPYVTLDSYTINDSVGGNNNHLADFGETIQLNVTVNNVGIATADNLTGTLASADTNVTISANIFSFGTIPAGGSATGENAFTVIVNNDVADQHHVMSVLTLTNGTDTWTSNLMINLNAPSLSVTTITVWDPTPGGNNNGVLDPGETATLKIGTINNGHADVSNGTGHLTVLPGSTSFILVNNPNTYIGNLAVNQTVNVIYQVITNGITPPGTTVNLNYLETAGSANQYSVQKPFDLTIGALPSYLMQNGAQTTCSGNFYDAGGPNNNYANGEDFTMTFTPATTGAKLKIEFSEFSLESQTNCDYDYLKIFNGPDIAAPLIGKYCGTDMPPAFTSTHASGTLTFTFHSDYSDNFPGWVSTLNCVGGPLNLIANAFPPTVCLGSSSQLTVIPSGGSGNYTYLWSPATGLDDPTSATPISTPESTITYTATVNDGTNSLTSSPITVTVNPVPEAPVITENLPELVSSSPLGNQWYLNGNTIPGATQQSYTPQISAEYYVRVKDETTGCWSEPSNTIAFFFTGINESSTASMVQVYPNPFQENFTISYELPESGNVTITLLDAYGKDVRHIVSSFLQSQGKHTATCHAGDLPASVYYCKVQTNSYSIVKKVILSR